MYGNHWINVEELRDWDISIEKVVGGFIWLGFSKTEPELMLCISTDKSTIFNCKSGTIIKTVCEYDETEHIAICEDLKDNFVLLAGQYGGSLPQFTTQGEKIKTERNDVFEYGKNLVRERVFLCSVDGIEHEIYEGYVPYTYGFSDDGNYFVFADDGGVTVLKRIQL